MPDWFYEQCARCGDQAGKFAHVIAASQRLICGQCWAQLKFDQAGHKVDDMVTPDDRAGGYPVDNLT